MNVLLVEDRGEVSYYLIKLMEERGYTVLDAFNLNDAQTYWDRRQEHPVDCIIADSNLPMDGLSEDERARSVGGLLSGWLWLVGHVFTEEVGMRRSTAIYSGYLEEFRKYVAPAEYEGIPLIPKRKGASPSEAVLKWVEGVGRSRPVTGGSPK